MTEALGHAPPRLPVADVVQQNLQGCRWIPIRLDGVRCVEQRRQCDQFWNLGIGMQVRPFAKTETQCTLAGQIRDFQEKVAFRWLTDSTFGFTGKLPKSFCIHATAPTIGCGIGKRPRQPLDVMRPRSQGKSRVNRIGTRRRQVIAGICECR